MIYRPDSTASVTKCYIEPRSRSKFPYLTIREMRVLFPDGNFTIIGEIGGLARSPDYADALIADGVRLLPILPRGSLKKPFEWVSGFVPVEGSLYIATICGIFCFALLRRKKGDSAKNL